LADSEQIIVVAKVLVETATPESDAERIQIISFVIGGESCWFTSSDDEAVSKDCPIVKNL
jgi:hypothetical protein